MDFHLFLRLENLQTDVWGEPDTCLNLNTIGWVFFRPLYKTLWFEKISSQQNWFVWKKINK